MKLSQIFTERKITVIERAEKYVAAMPPAISGSDGSGACLAVANALKHGFALSEDEAWPILLEYSERCSPPWSERELRHKWASAGRSHPMPLGYLRGEGTPQTAPAIPSKPIRLRSVSWQERAAEARKSMETLDATPLAASVTPEVQSNLVAAALRIFGGRILPDDGLSADMHDRLATIERVLAQRDRKGRVAYTRSEVESCAIGLRRHAGTHPAIDGMLHRLNEAKKTALGWQELSRRWRG